MAALSILAWNSVDRGAWHRLQFLKVARVGRDQ